MYRNFRTVHAIRDHIKRKQYQEDLLKQVRKDSIYMKGFADGVRCAGNMIDKQLISPNCECNPSKSVLK